MDKMKMETPDLTQENVEKLLALFPECATEVKQHGKVTRGVNFDVLQQLLTPYKIEGEEAYEFTWVGKKAAFVEANRPIRKTLRPVPEKSKDWQKTENLYIEGDNLETLKLLQEAYLGKVKMIYIDPPYNTGNDFIYNDSFKMSKEELAEGMGLFDEEGNKQFTENPVTNPQFHSDWCSMIYSRLLVAKNLLAEDGVIFISIDENEVTNLRKISDSVFGEDNFVVALHCQMSTTQGMKVKAAQEGNIVKNAEYVLCYNKNGKKNIAKQPLYDLRHKYDEHYSLYLKKDGNIAKLSELYNYKFPKDCNNKKPFSLSEAYEKSKEFSDIVRSHLADIVRSDKVTGFDIMSGLEKGKWKLIERNGKKYILTLDKNGNLKQLLRLKDSWGKTDGFYAEEGLRKIRGDWWEGFYIDMGNVSKEGDVQFANGKKPVRLIKQLVKMITSHNDIILDFFSGSATTAHAVMQMNAEDGGHRRFIMVQLPEKTDEKSEAKEAGFDTICDIGEERIRRAGEKIKAESPLTTKELDTGFRIFRVDDSNMKDVYYSADEVSQDALDGMISNIKEDRSALDLLFGCLVDWGIPLSKKCTSETVDGHTIYDYGEGDLLASFDTDISESVIEAMARKKPLRAIFRDGCFSGSQDKINVFEIFKMLSPDTTIRVL